MRSPLPRLSVATGFLSLCFLATPWCSSSANASDVPWWSAQPTVSIGPAQTSVRAFGAVGNGRHDDTAAFQKAVDALPNSGGTVRVPAGTYRIDAVTSVRLRSHVRVVLAPEATVQALPNGAQRYAVFKLASVTDVEITGGHIQGERAAHFGQGGEWGMGVELRNAHNVFLHDFTVSECWGDGIYVGALGSGKSVKPSSNVTINHVVSDHNRRQGLSITPANLVYVTNSTFSNTQGTLPQDGIDIEPMLQGTTDRIRLENNTMVGNAGSGLEIRDHVTHVGVVKNTIQANRGYGITTDSPVGGDMLNNLVANNLLAGVAIRRHSRTFTLDGNVMRGNNARYWHTPVGTGDVRTKLNRRDIQIDATTSDIHLGTNYCSK